MAFFQILRICHPFADMLLNINSAVNQFLRSTCSKIDFTFKFLKKMYLLKNGYLSKCSYTG